MTNKDEFKVKFAETVKMKNIIERNCMELQDRTKKSKEKYQ